MKQKLLFVLVITALVLTACGGAVATQPPAETEPPVATEPEPVAYGGSRNRGAYRAASRGRDRGRSPLFNNPPPSAPYMPTSGSQQSPHSSG